MLVDGGVVKKMKKVQLASIFHKACPIPHQGTTRNISEEMLISHSEVFFLVPSTVMKQLHISNIKFQRQQME